MTTSPYLRSHKVHYFKKSLEGERKIIERGDHLPVIHALNREFEKKGISINYNSFEDNYGDDALSEFNNKMGVDASFDLVNTKTREVIKEGYTIDYKFRDPDAPWNDFLAEIVSQDFGPYSNRMSVPGWAVAKHKINDAILYILPYHKKAALIGRRELKAGFDNGRFPLYDWNGKDRRKYAKSEGWRTTNVPIDWNRLMKVCPRTMIFNYE